MIVEITSKSGYTTREVQKCPSCGRIGPTSYKHGDVVDLDDRLAIKLMRHGIVGPAKVLRKAKPADAPKPAKKVAKPAPAKVKEDGDE